MDSAAAEPLQWRHNPWREKPRKTYALLTVNLAVMAIVYCTFPEKAWVVLAAVLLFGATLSMLVPIAYRFDDQGVAVFFLGTRSFRPSPHYRNYYVHSNGVFLTSMEHPNALDPFRGHFLFYRGNREQVLAYVKGRIKR